MRSSRQHTHVATNHDVSVLCSKKLHSDDLDGYQYAGEREEAVLR